MLNFYKSTLRNTYKRARAELSIPFQKEASQKICNTVKHMPQYQQAQHIGFYQSIGGEINLDDLWLDACTQKKNAYFPVIVDDKKNLRFLPRLPDTPTKINRFGILEPELPLSQAVSVKKLELIFVPLLAFDRFGNRLGRGQGYYDFTLKKHQDTFLIGLAYAFQQEPMLLTDSWDIPLDCIVTEEAILEPHIK